MIGLLVKESRDSREDKPTTHRQSSSKDRANSLGYSWKSNKKKRAIINNIAKFKNDNKKIQGYIF